MNQVEFIELANYPDYEILTIYPFTIRDKLNHLEVIEYQNDGYINLKLNGKNYKKHRIIAEQFIPNPNNYPEVDHINRDRSDYHLSNLRWIDHSGNNRNKSSYKGIESKYVDEIDPDAIIVDYYNTKTEKHLFTDYYYYEGIFYYDTGNEYRILNVITSQYGSKYVNMRSNEGKCIKVVINRFLAQHDM